MGMPSMRLSRSASTASANDSVCNKKDGGPVSSWERLARGLMPPSDRTPSAREMSDRKRLRTGKVQDGRWRNLMRKRKIMPFAWRTSETAIAPLALGAAGEGINASLGPHPKRAREVSDD